MKIPLFAVMLLWSGLVITAEAQVEGKATPELKALQSRYKADVQAALKPIQDRYIAQYEALSRSFTTRGDLAAAVAVQQEIAALRKAATEEVGGTAVSRQQLEKQVLGVWYYGSPKIWLSLREDGKAYLDKLVLTWTVNAEKSIVLTDPQRPGAHATLEFDSRVESFTAKDFDGKRLSGTRKEQ